MDSINPITPRTETVVILQGDDDERVRLLTAEVERIEKAKPKSAGAAARALHELDPLAQWEADKKAAEELHDEFLAEAEKRGVKVVLRALGRKTWRELIAKYPPRSEGEGVSKEKAESDKQFGANLDALQEELVALCMASPAGSNEERAAFLDSLNEGQFGDLAIKAYFLNMGRAADPTQRLSSEGSRTSDETSNSPSVPASL